MKEINWLQEVEKRKEALIKDTQAFLQIDSVLDENSKDQGAPFGKGIKDALDYLLEKGAEDGFAVKNVDGYAGHIEHGAGEELVGILCHIDVVPPGDGWTSEPFSAEIRDGKIFARGALDDKGPTMAAYYALKIVKELGIKTNRRARIIIGTDEESSWQCVDHYFKHEEMPAMGFAPDADFPIIYAEKGIFDCTLMQDYIGEEQDGEFRLKSFKSGLRLNMVPDLAVATLTGPVSTIVDSFQHFLSEHDLKGSYELEGDEITLKVNGVSAHGMEPKNGVNAGTELIKFLHTLNVDSKADDFIGFAHDYLVDDSRGHSLGIATSDDISGDLTMNVGKLAYDQASGGTLGLNIRYPVTHEISSSIDQLNNKASEFHFSIASKSNSNPHHVDKNHELIRTLQSVYTKQTGEEATLISIGGGTYARSLKAGVAFGPLFPGRPDIAHQKDEYIEVGDLLHATAIYAEAIYELIK